MSLFVSNSLMQLQYIYSYKKFQRLQNITVKDHHHHQKYNSHLRANTKPCINLSLRICMHIFCVLYIGMIQMQHNAKKILGIKTNTETMKGRFKIKIVVNLTTQLQPPESKSPQFYLNLSNP